MSGRSVAVGERPPSSAGTWRGAVQLTPTATSPATSAATATASAIGSPAAVWPPSRHWYDSQAARPSSSSRRPAPPPRARSGWSPSPAGRAGLEEGVHPRRMQLAQGGRARVVVAAVLGAVGEHRPVRSDRSGDEQARPGRPPARPRARRGPAGRPSTLVRMAVERRRPIQPAAAKPGTSPGSWPSWRPGRRPRSTRGGRPRWPPGRSAAAAPTRIDRTGRGRAPRARSPAPVEDDRHVSRVRPPPEGDHRDVVGRLGAGGEPRRGRRRSPSMTSCGGRPARARRPPAGRARRTGAVAGPGVGHAVGVEQDDVAGGQRRPRSRAGRARGNAPSSGPDPRTSAGRGAVGRDEQRRLVAGVGQQQPPGPAGPVARTGR